MDKLTTSTTTTFGCVSVTIAPELGVALLQHPESEEEWPLVSLEDGAPERSLEPEWDEAMTYTSRAGYALDALDPDGVVDGVVTYVLVAA